MAEVSLNINGRSYGVACDDGQEQRVMDVGTYVDTRVRDIAGAGAASNETHLLVLTSLVLADEIKEIRDQLQMMQNNVTQPAAPVQAAAPTGNNLNEDEKGQVIEFIDHFTARIDAVVDRLQKIA